MSSKDAVGDFKFPMRRCELFQRRRRGQFWRADVTLTRVFTSCFARDNVPETAWLMATRSRGKVIRLITALTCCCNVIRDGPIVLFGARPAIISFRDERRACYCAEEPLADALVLRFIYCSLSVYESHIKSIWVHLPSSDLVPCFRYECLFSWAVSFIFCVVLFVHKALHLLLFKTVSPQDFFLFVGFDRKQHETYVLRIFRFELMSDKITVSPYINF